MIPDRLDWGRDRNSNWHRRWLTLVLCGFAMGMSAYCLFRFGLPGMANALAFFTGGALKAAEYHYQRRREGQA